MTHSELTAVLKTALYIKVRSQQCNGGDMTLDIWQGKRGLVVVMATDGRADLCHWGGVPADPATLKTWLD